MIAAKEISLPALQTPTHTSVDQLHKMKTFMLVSSNKNIAALLVFKDWDWALYHKKEESGDGL